MTEEGRGAADLDATLFKEVARSVDCGLAITDPDWSIVFENGLFFRWFQPVDDEAESLADRVPDFSSERARAAPGAAGPTASRPRCSSTSRSSRYD